MKPTNPPEKLIKLKRLPSWIALVLAVAGLANTSHAEDLGIAGRFNAFLFGNFNTSGYGHSQGAIAVQGNWIGDGYVTNTDNYATGITGFSYKVGNTTYNAVDPGIFVGGSVTKSGNLSVLVEKGNAYYGTGNGNAIEVRNGYNKYSGTNTGIFSVAEQYLGTISDELANTASVALSFGTVNLAANTLNGSLRLYHIDGSLLGNLQTLDFINGTSTDTIVINVLNASTVNWSTTVNYSGGYNKILWNFVGVDTLNVKDRALHGSILALGATVNQFSNIDGTVIAENLNTNNHRELHQFTFTGDLPMSTVAIVPEPGSLVLLLAGFTLILRNRRRASA